jgi:hypothetical protein
VEGSSKSVTIGLEIDAIVDDKIYATIIDYDFYEYPVYYTSTLAGYILVTIPRHIEHSWFPGKLPSTSDWIPNHEVGNILSYKEYPELDYNDEVAALIAGTYDNSIFLDATSSANWELNFQDFISSGTSTTKTNNREIGGTFNFFGLFTIGSSRTYSDKEFYTHKISVTQDLSLNVHLDNLDMSIGQVYYKVTPYAYWGKNGALVMDYAVKPDLAEFDQLWWQLNYGEKPDPAFILPWRYDPEKNLKLDDLTWRNKTKEIIFHPSQPVEGDTVTIYARLHNFSLLPMRLVKVRFYVGDPDSGGTIIVGTNGETEVSTSENIMARENTFVEMKWIIPHGLPQHPRIYAVIDPDNEIDEIHENNNKGWSVLGKEWIVGVVDKMTPDLPTTYALKQNYPNPFNPITTIKYEIPEPVDVEIRIYNILGRLIYILVDEHQQPGRYEYKWSGETDTNGYVSSGIYLYQIKAGDYIHTKKMVYVK